MTRRPLANVAASVRARLLQVAHTGRLDFLVVLQRFALERLLHRLTLSAHADRYTLKGAMLFSVWSGSPHRATRDLDLLSQGAPDLDELVTVWREVAACQADDGVRFDPESVAASVIREGRIYEGVRVIMLARLEAARIDLQIDVGFGDAVVPSPQRARLPVLLDFPAPELRTYAPETVVAEKLHAMVEHGALNTRLKDYFDVWWLMERDMIDDNALADAVAATFARRQTPLPTAELPALSSDYAHDPARAKQWVAFCRRAVISQPPSLPAAVEAIAPRLWGALRAARER